MVWQHDRDYDHRETEDCSTVVLSTDIGRYEAGTPLCEVLADLVARYDQIQSDYAHGFFVFGLNAFIAPYDPAGILSGVFGLEAVLRGAGTGTFGLDAEIAEAVEEERLSDFGLYAYIHLSDAPVGQLAAPIDADDTVIIITNPGDFPTTCPYDLQIGDEIVTVVGGCGTDTLTIVRGTGATSHPAGSITVTC